MDITQTEQAARHFTIAAVYDDNQQRYCTSGEVGDPTEAAALAMFNVHVDNKFPESITIYGVFEGEHECKDIYVGQADERPKFVPSRAKARHPFTVVREYDTCHVNAANGRLAELACADEYDNVASVFAGNLTNLVGHADLKAAKALAAKWVAEYHAENATQLSSYCAPQAAPEQGATL